MHFLGLSDRPKPFGYKYYNKDTVKRADAKKQKNGKSHSPVKIEYFLPVFDSGYLVEAALVAFVV